MKERHNSAGADARTDASGLTAVARSCPGAILEYSFSQGLKPHNTCGEMGRNNNRGRDADVTPTRACEAGTTLRSQVTSISFPSFANGEAETMSEFGPRRLLGSARHLAIHVELSMPALFRH